MDNFTLAVVIGMALVICIFLGLAIVDKGPPPPDSSSKSPKKNR